MADATDHAAQLDGHIDVANASAAHLAASSRVAHNYEIAFVHALAGAEEKAREALKAAQLEMEKFVPGTFSHLTHEISLLEARVHALLSKGHPEPDRRGRPPSRIAPADMALLTSTNESTSSAKELR